MPTSVVLVDDVDELRAVLRQALRLRGGLEVLAEARDGQSAIAAAEAFQPDLVVLDLGLPDLAGREVLTGIRTVAPRTQIVVYSGSHTADRAALTEAVEGYVDKQRDVGYLVDLLVDLGTRPRQVASVTLGPGLRHVAFARLFVANQCREWGRPSLIEDAQLAVTELVTNALLYGSETCELRIGIAGSVLRIEVFDQGGGAPDLQAAAQDAESGRGLFLVSILCLAWGVQAMTDGGKCVWAEIPAERAQEPDRHRPAARGPERSGRPAPTSELPVVRPDAPPTPEARDRRSAVARVAS